MKLEAFSYDSDSVRVVWESGRINHYHHIWLRDNCPSARHPTVGEKILDPIVIPLDIKPGKIALKDNNHLQISWANDGHVSEFDLDWLYANAYDAEARQARRYQPALWTTEDLADYLPEVQYDSIMTDDASLLEWLQLLRRYGFAIVRDVPTRTGMVLKVAERISFLRDTNFGTLFNVESKPDPNSLAYTAVKLNAHTDLVSREAQPGLQFLHCLVFDAAGGESLLVDGFAVAEAFKSEYPEDYELLTHVPVRYRYQDKSTDVNAKFPMIRLDAEGDYFEIRYSTALMAPLDIDPHLVKSYYRAYQNFTRLLRAPQFEYNFKLQPGDCEVFDNRRVLHGRAEFNPQSGPRHLQGCYIDTDDFLSRLRVLERHGSDFRDSLSIAR
jgi:gamma-butyrobetaine dioxygenase